MRLGRVPRHGALALLGLGACLALAAPATAGSVTPNDGSWQGTVGPNGLSFRVVGEGSEIVGASTSFDPGADCGIPVSKETHFALPRMAVHDGHFHGTFTEGEMTLVVQGQFDSPRQASGKIVGSLTVPHNALPPCHATRTFEASLEHGA